MSIRTSFSIKDLEHLSGIKAHTIRIWEKRYGILSPTRSDSNIRSYDIDSLKKLLNVAILNESGVKVSKISLLSEIDLNAAVRELMIHNNSHSHAINSFKLAMLNFDSKMFDDTYNHLILEYSFREIFMDIFRKLLDQIGMLWLTNSISPAHEHFISTLIMQKLLINMERIKNSDTKESPVFVLFLPLDEIHELAIMYVHFELLLKGYRTIYLGGNTPIEVVKDLQNVFDEIIFISYVTVEPVTEKMPDYCEKFANDILSQRPKDQLYIGGKNVGDMNSNGVSTQVHLAKDLPDLLNLLGGVMV